MRESRIEGALVRRVHELGGYAIKLAAPGHRGAPDRLVLLPGGRVMFVEVKAPGRRPTALQARMHARLVAMGFRVETLDNLEAVDALLS